MARRIRVPTKVMEIIYIFFCVSREVKHVALETAKIIGLTKAII